MRTKKIKTIIKIVAMYSVSFMLSIYFISNGGVMKKHVFMAVVSLWFIAVLWFLLS